MCDNFYVKEQTVFRESTVERIIFIVRMFISSDFTDILSLN